MSEQQIFKTPEEKLADLGKYLPLRIAYSLHPTGFEFLGDHNVKIFMVKKLEAEEQILLKPDIVLDWVSSRHQKSSENRVCQYLPLRIAYSLHPTGLKLEAEEQSVFSQTPRHRANRTLEFC